MIDKTIVLKRVNDGIAYLEKTYPGWLYAFELDDILRLDINNPLDCVLGVLARNILGMDEGFYDLKRYWSLSWQDVQDMGFYGELTEGQSIEYHIAYTDALNTIWQSLLMGLWLASRKELTHAVV